MSWAQNLMSRWFGIEQPARCGVAEKFAAGSPNKWKLRELLWTRIEGPSNIAASVVDDTIVQALKYWEPIDPPGFKFTRTNREGLANIVFRGFRKPAFGFDGPGGIIENSTSPTNSEFVNQCIVAIDLDENWGVGILVNQKDLLKAYGHGIGHGLGLTHDTQPGNLMSGGVLGNIQRPTARDYQRLLELYAGPTPGPQPIEPPFVRVSQGKLTWEGLLKATN